MKNAALKAVVLCLSLATAAAASAATLLVECESFKEKGGWGLDAQFMDQMGSPFLLAHGMGKPVADASTRVAIPASGAYRVWARTRNWAATWSPRAEAPGRFRVLVNGAALTNELGVGSADWSWQFAGIVTNLMAGPATLSLHDLTGFDGRCDALVLSSDSGFMPPATKTALARFRFQANVHPRVRSTADADLVVVGGGIAGTCAAISAARLGLKVALINDRPLLGGCNSSEVRVHLGGRVHLPPYSRLGDVVDEIGPAREGNAKPADYYEDARKLAVVRAEKNIALFLNTRVTRTEKLGDRLLAVYGENVETGDEIRFAAPLFVDATGDGAVGALAGATFRYGRESKSATGEARAVEVADAQTMGASVQWYSATNAVPVVFPDLPWALPFTDKSCERVTMGEWTWETGMRLDQITDFEQIRDYGLLVVYSNWTFLKNHASDKDRFAYRSLSWVAYVAGKRESRRLVGDLVLTQKDLMDGTVYPDGTACTSWSIDLHDPDPKNATNFPAGPFKSIATHTPIHLYPIPYRCLYSKDISNLFMAGRDISVTHVALGTVRVMRTGGMLGEVVGMAASVCKKNGCSPRDVYSKHFSALKALMEKGIGLGKPQPPQDYNQGHSLGIRALVPVSQADSSKK